MASRREMILARILVICQTVTGIKTCERNAMLADDEKRDLINLLDGDESVRGNLAQKGRASLMPPQLMDMRPELFVVLKEQRPRNPDVGTKLNDFQIRLINAIATDPELATLLGSNGGVAYNGCATDLKSGSTLSGTMRLDFTYTYPLIPTA